MSPLGITLLLILGVPVVICLAIVIAACAVGSGTDAHLRE